MKAFLLVLSVLLINLTVFEIFNTEFTAGFILVVLSPLFLFQKIRFNFVFLFLYLIILLFDLTKYLLFESFAFNFKQFFLTHFQIFVLLVLMAIYDKSKLKSSILTSFGNIFRIIGGVILVSIILQYWSFYFSVNQFYNFFGDLQWTYQLVLPNFRPKSFFLEPSYLGLVLNILLLIDFTIDNSPRFFSLYRNLIILGIFSSFSLFGIVICFMTILLFYFLKYDRKITIANLLIIGLMVVGLFSLDISNRFSEITTQNTSGFERLAFPILVTDFMFNNMEFYVGVPLGLDYLLLDQLDQFMDVRLDTIQNSFFLLIIYSGVLFIPFLILYIYKLLGSPIVPRIYFLIVPFLLFNSGGLYSLYYSFFVFLLPILALKVQNDLQWK